MSFFGFLLMLTALVIAGVAGYFSVYGLAYIYPGAFVSVILMGGALEVGKLIATSYLYRYWTTTGFLLKTYLIVAVFGLMLITSSGIFGYLSSAYQKDTVGIKDVAARIELLDKEYAELTVREQEIDADINRVGSNYVTARLNLMKQYAGEKTALTERRNAIRTEKLELSTHQLEVEAHTGPIIYIAKAMNKTIDDAVLWMSLLIIAVFDPLAIALTIAANSVFLQNKKLKEATKPPVEVTEKIVEVEKLVEVPVERLVEAPVPDGQMLVEAQAFNQIHENMMEMSKELERMTKRNEELQTLLEELNAAEVLEDQAHNRLEVALQHQVNKLNEDILQASQDLSMAIEALEKREAKIDQLEQNNADLEQQIVDLRMQLRKFELSATERAKLHQQNIADSKSS